MLEGRKNNNDEKHSKAGPKHKKNAFKGGSAVFASPKMGSKNGLPDYLFSGTHARMSQSHEGPQAFSLQILH